jgi:hypothetical protein
VSAREQVEERLHELGIDPAENPAGLDAYEATVQALAECRATLNDQGWPGMPETAHECLRLEAQRDAQLAALGIDVRSWGRDA